MEERHEHRGFLITVSTRDDGVGGAMVTLLIERLPKEGEPVQGGRPMPEPEHYRSLRAGPAAVGEAMERARHAIDDALGDPDPFGE